MKSHYQLFALCLTLLFTACNQAIELPLEFKAPDSTFEFNYNENWELENSDDPSAKILLIHADEKDYEDFRDNINLMAIPAPPNLDFDGFVRGSKNYFKINNWNLIEESQIEINGQQAYRIVTEQKFEGHDYRILQILQLANRTRYTLTFTSRKSRYDGYAKEAEEIMRSFRFGE